jgi:hypothetical protein
MNGIEVGESIRVRRCAPEGVERSGVWKIQDLQSVTRATRSALGGLRFVLEPTVTSASLAKFIRCFAPSDSIRFSRGGEEGRIQDEDTERRQLL